MFRRGGKKLSAGASFERRSATRRGPGRRGLPRYLQPGPSTIMRPISGRMP